MIKPLTTTTYLPGPTTSTATSVVTLVPATVTNTKYITPTTTDTETSVHTLLTVTTSVTIVVNRYTVVATTTASLMSTATETSCLYSPTPPADADFDVDDGTWVLPSFYSTNVKWSIDNSNPHNGPNSGHLFFNGSGATGYGVQAPIPQLCPTKKYRVTLWAVNSMNGWKGSCIICFDLGNSHSCIDPLAQTIGSTWASYTQDIVFPESGMSPKLAIEGSCYIDLGTAFMHTVNVDVWVDDLTIESL
ncbi:hypothetical protein ABW20_dc0107581 [Dactylellina cionopaga]|nr:hypothetical protein ABW20_dc0107581 [Dactylellina cionopaga]